MSDIATESSREAEWPNATYLLVKTIRCNPLCSCLAEIYYFIHTQKLEWHDAVAHCSNSGRRQAQVRSQDEYDHVMRLLLELELDRLWLGGDDLTTEGEWLWQPLNGDVSDPVDLNGFWQSGRPAPDNSRNCLQFSTDGFTDKSCGLRRYVVCVN